MDRRLLSILIFAFLCRLVALPASYLRINPYSQADTIGYATHASRFATELASGSFPALNLRDIYDIWGLALSPFWLLPGPSGLYARAVLIVMSLLIIYNIYTIASYYHSQQAGILATLPIAFYPSFVLMHSTLHREATLLVGLTTALRLLVAPGGQVSKPVRVIIISSCLVGATILRRENLILYILALGIGTGVYLAARYNRLKQTAITGVLISIVGVIIASPIISKGVDYLARVHQVRARGRTAYFVDIAPTTIPELVAFSWIGAAYFYFTPFPWMIHTISDVVVGIEAILNLMYGLSAIGGFRILLNKNISMTVSLAITFVIGSILYGVADANVGTAVRHRQMFVWVIYVFGAIWISNQVQIDFSKLSSARASLSEETQ